MIGRLARELQKHRSLRLSSSHSQCNSIVHLSSLKQTIQNNIATIPYCIPFVKNCGWPIISRFTSCISQIEIPVWTHSFKMFGFCF